MIEPFLDAVINVVNGSERLLLDAFHSVADPSLKASTVAEVKRHMAGVAISSGISWLLFDTISALVRKLPIPMRKVIAELDGIQNGYPIERLRVAEDGRWQLGWQVDGIERVALDWYVPPDRDAAPVVPVPVIDFVAGSLLLYQSRLALPAAANLLIALESVLWDRLAASGHPRMTERVVYSAASWNYKLINADRLQIMIEGADEALSGFATAAGGKEGSFSLRKSHESDEQAVLQLGVPPALVPYLTTESATSRELVSEKGLAEAIQRARKLGILETLPVQLDELLFRLRNGLLHLPYNGVITPPIPNPAGGVITDLEVLRRDLQFVGQVIETVVNLINTLYAKA
jgi:hypothetical protein